MRKEPEEYEIYRHFKGSFYQIVAIAVHTETKEKMVIYRALKNSAHVFARPLNMFMSEVDKKKYPDIDVKYRFTKIEGDEVNIKLGEEADGCVSKSDEFRNVEVKTVNIKMKNGDSDITDNGDKCCVKDNEVDITSKNDSYNILVENVETDNGANIIDKIKSECDSDDEDMDTRKYKDDGSLVIDPLVERVLDEKDFAKKIEAFQLMRNKCDSEMLTQIAISLDIKLTSDTIEGNYAEIMKVLRMHEKYETGRLR